MAQLLQRQFQKCSNFQALRLFSSIDSRKEIAEKVPVAKVEYQRGEYKGRFQEIKERKETGLMRLENQLQQSGPDFMKHHTQEAREQDDLSGLGEQEGKVEGDELNHKVENYILLRDKIMQQKQYERMLEKHNDQDSRLVKRPTKDFLWGYGTKVFDENKDSFFRKGQLPTIKELIRFCEAYQMADITVVNIKLGPRKQIENFAIICSGYSGRHIYHTAKTLVRQLKMLECPEIVNTPKLAGRKEDLWAMVVAKEVQVHFILEDFREILDLEFKFLNQINEEELEDWRFWSSIPKRKPDYPVHNTGPSKKPKVSKAEKREYRKQKREEEMAKDTNLVKDRTETQVVFDLLEKRKNKQELDFEEEEMERTMQQDEEELTLGELLLKKKMEKKMREDTLAQEASQV